MSYIVNKLVINRSTRGVTGYEGATFSPAWTLNEQKPFIAAIGNPTDTYLKTLLTAKDRTALHLGQYSDSREAAYVVAMYKNDPENVLLELRDTGTLVVEFPKELYALPELLTCSEAQEQIKKTTVIKTDDRPADKNFAELNAKYNINELAKRFGKELLLQSRKYLTINEFELRFGLVA